MEAEFRSVLKADLVKCYNYIEQNTKKYSHDLILFMKYSLKISDLGKSQLVRHSMNHSV